MATDSGQVLSPEAAGAVALPHGFKTGARDAPLDDGRRVAIRSILPTDRVALKAFFESLTPGTRRLRFHVSLKDLPESLLHRFTAIDHCNHIGFIAETRRTADRPTALVAEARCVRYEDSDSAELALVVAEGWRRVGLGTSLARMLMERARLAGLRHLSGDALLDNEEILGFMRSLGARATAGAEDAETVRLWLDL